MTEVGCAARCAELTFSLPGYLRTNTEEIVMPVILWVGLPILLVGGGLIYFIVR